MAIRSTEKRNPGSSLAGSQDPEEQDLLAILVSAGFEKSLSVRSLLVYLWRQRGTPISEYAIGVEALGRHSNFDPKTDSTVRVQISRLRQKLKEFYDGEGQTSRFRISIPLGTHELKIQSCDTGFDLDGVSKLRPAPEGSKQAPKAGMLALAALALSLAAVCAWLAVENRTLAAARPENAETVLPRFWKFFTANKKPVAVFLLTPVFFEWSGGHTSLKLRDTRINDFSDFHRSPELEKYAKEWGPPKLLQNYAVASDALAALKLSQFLQPRGIRLSIGTTADLSFETLRDHNTLILGTPGISSRYLKKLLDQSNFQFDESGHHVFNRRPAPGEPAEVREDVQSRTRTVSPAVMTVVSSKTGGTLLLTLIGQQTAPLASLLTNPSFLPVFDTAWRKAGSPRFFESVLAFETDGSTVLKAWPVAFRPASASGWEEIVTAPQ